MSELKADLKFLILPFWLNQISNYHKFTLLRAALFPGMEDVNVKINRQHPYFLFCLSFD